MNEITDQTQILELEWHQLDLCYQSLRIHTKAAIQRFMLSINKHELLMPITVIPSGVVTCPWIVIDGYLRIAAIKALGRDSITAIKWDVTVPDGLIKVYKQTTSRPWDRIEEAHLIHELIVLHGFNQEQIAQRLGKSASWISYRLQLVHNLPAYIHEAIHKGLISTWSATRVLIPFARANAKHTAEFVAYLCSKKHSSRDILAFYEHYLRSNCRVRQQIVENPSLFFKVHELAKYEDTTQQDKFSPEYLWISKIDLMIVCTQVLKSITPAVFYPQQDSNQTSDLLKPFNQLLSDMNALQNLLQRSTDA